MPELAARAAQTARFNRTPYARLNHARCGRGIREGQRRGDVHVLRTVAQSMIRNVAPAMVTEVFTLPRMNSDDQHPHEKLGWG